MLIRLSRESEYALEGLSVLAGQPAGTVMVLREIAELGQLPVGLLARTFQRLGRHGLVVSHRGGVRGYALARAAREISVSEIFEAVEGPGILARCLFSTGRCPRPVPCRLHPLWAALSPTLRQVMARTTLDDVVPRVVRGRRGRPRRSPRSGARSWEDKHA